MHCQDEDVIIPPPASGKDIIALPPSVDVFLELRYTEQVHTIGKRSNPTTRVGAKVKTVTKANTTS